MVTQADLGESGYDIVANARYNQDTSSKLTRLRSASLTAKTWGLSLRQQNPLDSLCLDRHRQIPHDPAHALLQGISQQLIRATLDLFNQVGQEALVRRAPLPAGWARFQNPIEHLKSFFFSDFARLIMIGPFLVVQLQQHHYDAQKLEDIKLHMNLSHSSQVLNAILRCWILLAQTNALAFSASFSRDTYSDMEMKVHTLVSQLLKVRSLCE